MVKKVNLETIEDVTEGCDKHCLFKTIIRRIGFDERGLEQMKCMHLYRDELAEKEGKRKGWMEISEIWIEKGYAEKFARAYEQNKDEKTRVLYDLIMGKNKSD